MLVKIKDILPNPFRHMERYPINKVKVAQLRESIQSTEFWDNIVARKTTDGKAEIAYGHHRLVALREEYGPSHEVTLIIKPLDDEAMLKVMARENMEEWGSSAAVEHETIRAVVEAYAAGKIELEKPARTLPEAQLRYAPSFIPGGEGSEQDRSHPYTITSLGDFIGWKEPSGKPQLKVADALAALQFIEEGLLREKDFDGLSTMQAHAVVTETRQVRAQQRSRTQQAEAAAKAAAKAKDTKAEKKYTEKARASKERERERASTVGKHVSQRIKSGEIGYKRARQAAREADTGREDKDLPRIEAFADQLAADLSKILATDSDPRVKKLLAIIVYRDQLGARQRNGLAKVLESLAKRAQRFADQLQAPVSGRTSSGRALLTHGGVA